MTNAEYVAAVEKGLYPADPLVPLDEPFKNEAGRIRNLVFSNSLRGAEVVISKHGALRSNHYHKTDWHYLYVASGAVWYYWRDAGSKLRPERRVFNTGEMFFTPPRVEHATYFPQDTTLFSLSRNPRDHASHEADLVRVKLIHLDPTGRPVYFGTP